MDVEVVGAGVARVAYQDFLKDCYQFQSTRLGCAVVRPEFPRAQIHARLDKHHRRMQVIGILVHEVAHRPIVSRIQRRSRGTHICRIPLCHSIDVRLLAR